LRIRLPLASFELDVDLETSARSLGVFGASGAGKTSLLEVIAGWRTPRSGHVRVGSRVFHDSTTGVSVPVRDRGIGYVPQDALLFPHWTVEQNLRAGRRRGEEPPSQEEIGRAVEVLELETLLPRRADALSGGERQHAALGRALVSRPGFLLLDEPLGALDLPLRRRILPYLIRVRAAFDLPMMVVSHDATEIQALCEEVAVLERGRVVASGPADRVLRERAGNGYENVLSGRVAGVHGGTADVDLDDRVRVQIPAAGLSTGERVVFSLGADEILVSLSPIEGISARNRLPAVIEDLVETEGSLIARAAVGDVGVTAPRLSIGLTRASAEELRLAPGRRVHLVFKTQSCRVLS
jgi:molybdate transport system ATP-binding protein